MRKRLLLLATLAVAVGLPVAQSAASSAATPKLNGTVGPGFTILLKNAQGKKVTTLKAGSYSFVVNDKSSIHNFVVEKTSGGKVEKELTTVGGTGTKTKTVALTKGTWKVYCDPHPSMRQNFTVT